MRDNIKYFALASHPNDCTSLVPLLLEESEEGVLINTGNLEAVH